MATLVGGRFEIVREAGAGAMARVYEARDLTTGAIVALKILRDAGEHTMRRFAREVAALVELSHPGIVRYISHGRTTTGEAFLAMEWLAGEPLDQRLERGPLSVTDALTVGRCVAAALGAAHAQSIVHRDVKPANIFLVAGDPAQVKLLDFGLVRDLDATFALTSTGDLIGTPLFMAPEQASCDPSLDARVDVYSLGAVLYACITGRAPIIAGNIVALLAKIVLEEPAPPSSFEPDIPLIVDELLARFLAKVRDQRPADGTLAVSAIDAAAAGLAGSPRGRLTTLPAREQRVVSILLSSSAGPASASLDATLGVFGGVLDLADGSTMVVFDGPETPGDLASRAARFALGLRRSSLAVSIATGGAVLSGPTPMGKVIDRAADQLARAYGLVRIDEDTAGLLEGRFEIAPDADGAILIGEPAGELDAVRTLLGRPTRCVGRDRELAAIEGFFAEVVADSTARAVIVIAEAGVGKSRLSNELLRRLAAHSEAPEAVVTRCESITERSPFAAAAAAVRRSAAIHSSERPEQQAEKLAARLAHDGVADPGVGEFLAEMLGIAVTPSERVEAARESPALMFERIRSAWTGWLSKLCAVRPLLLVIEDLHWADESSVLLVDASLAALVDAPFMVLALARPEVRARRPWAARKPQEMRLDPLSRRASERLVREAIGQGATDRMVGDILERAQGNPLFLEELVRASRHADGGELPVGIVGTLQRRFDALHPDARGVLRAASIFGERFTSIGIVPLVAERLSVPAMLDELVSAELVEQHADGFAFRHALVRDAAYALLAEADRALGHTLVAKRLAEETAPDPAVVGWHFEHGGQSALAAVWYARAAEHALVHNDLAGALRHAERAQRWTEDRGALGTLDLIVAEVELWRGDLDQARLAAERATTRVPRAGAQWFEAAGLIITAAGQVGRNDIVDDWLARAMELEPEPAAVSACVLCLSRGCSQLAWDRNDSARRALARAEAVATDAMSPMARARLEVGRAYVHMHDGRVDLCVDGLRGVAARYARLGARRDALQTTLISRILGNQGGDVEAGYPAILQCVAEAEVLDARYLADWARWSSAMSLFMLGELERAEAALSAVIVLVEKQPLFHDVTALYRAWARFASDDVDGLARLLATAAPSLRYARFKAALAGFAAYVRFRQGDPTGGCSDARDALVALAAAPGVYADGCLAGFSPALATLVLARAPDAADAVATHVARIEGLATALGTSDAREAFRTRVPWHAHVLALSGQLR